MNKLQKLIKVAGLLMAKPYLINTIIDDDHVWRKRVGKDHGIDMLPEVKYHDLAAGRSVMIRPFAFMEGGSLPTDLALLRILAGSFPSCAYFEIGTWRGESAANVAEVASTCTTLNLPASQMVDRGLDPSYIGQHAMFSEKLTNVTHLEGNSLEYDFASLKRKFDLIFIDGDHHYSSILSDTKNVFSHLVHDESIVVWHDYAWQPGNVRYETLASILGGVPVHLHNRVYGVKNTLCAIFYPGEIASGPASSTASVHEAFEVEIRPAGE